MVDKMNNKQTLVTSIMGKEFNSYFCFSKWHPYYNSRNKKEKLIELEEYSFIILGIVGMEKEEIEEVYNFLEKNFESENELQKEFEKLNKNATRTR
jgi:hypothetical protein